MTILQPVSDNLTFNSFIPFRLDSMSSGALILAKSPEAARETITAFRDHAVQKYYVAISDRKPSKKQGSVIGDMSRGRRGSWMLQRTSTNPSITRFTSVAVDGERQGLRALLLKPETGKTHQLRVAMKSLGAPVLGDVRYAQADVAKKEERGYLHCAAMRLTVRGEIHQVVCEPTEGVEFLTEGFKSVFNGWFPDGIDKEDAVWFPESKLLRSSMGERSDTRRKFLTEED